MNDFPLSLRLRRAVLVALILGLWAPVKVMWEQQIARQQDALRYRGVTMTRELRDNLSQGLSIALLGGLRGVVADFIWLDVTSAWEKQEWFRMASQINLVTALQPRFTTFWDLGGWQLAYNASVGAMNDKDQPNALRRIKNSRYWIDKGLDVYKRGIENNPEAWQLWADVGRLYQQRLQDYRSAAYYYQKASELPNAPVYLERFPAIMYGMAGDDTAAYEAWKALWLRLTPEEREMKQHWKEKIETNIRQLEQKLSIPKEKRIFPN